MGQKLEKNDWLQRRTTLAWTVFWKSGKARLFGSKKW